MIEWHPTWSSKVCRPGGTTAPPNLFRFYRATIGVIDMLHWAVVFFVIAIIAAVFGFTGIAAGAASIAKILFVVFLILFILSLLFGGLRRGPRI
jgi:uncharacterized membrane protein YtjA (UPF0391 family)